MAFIVEDGTGLSNANSMASVAEFDTYYTDRGNEEAIALTVEVKQALLVQGADYLTVMYQDRWIESLLVDTQSMPFPRTNLGVPDAIKTANIILAFKANDDSLIQDEERRVKKEKVSSLEITYDENDTQVGLRFTQVEALLKPYLIDSSNSEVFHKVVRT